MIDPHFRPENPALLIGRRSILAVAALTGIGVAVLSLGGGDDVAAKGDPLIVVPGTGAATPSMFDARSASAAIPSDAPAEEMSETRNYFNPADEPTTYAAGGGRRRDPVDAGAMRIDPPRQLTASQAAEDEAYLKRMAEDYRE